MEDTVVAGLKAALANDNSWLEWSTIAVFVGVLIELFELLILSSKEMGRKQRIAMFVATILVAGGCGGEWMFEHDAASIEGRLQQISDQKVASLALAEAADNKIAAQAAARAAELGISVRTATNSLAKLTTDEAAVSGKIDRDEDRLANRTLTKHQYDALLSLKGKVKEINVSIEPGDRVPPSGVTAAL